MTPLRRAARRCAAASFAALLPVGVAACGKAETPNSAPVTSIVVPGSTAVGATNPPSSTGAFTVTSTAFADGQPIPVKYTCKGDSVSPPLAWSGVPKGTQMLALTVVDPDAPLPGGFTHWVAYGIDPAPGSLGEATNRTSAGMNSANKGGYTGPCPPAGKPHHYLFTVYALDKQVTFAEAPSRSDIESLGKDALATATLTGTFQTS